MCMVPNIPGIPGPPLGGSSSGSNSPSGYSIHSEAKMVSTRLALYFCLVICFFCLHLYPPASLCTELVCSSYDFLPQLLVYLTLAPQQHNLYCIYDTARCELYVRIVCFNCISNETELMWPLFIVLQHTQNIHFTRLFTQTAFSFSHKWKIIGVNVFCC